MNLTDREWGLPHPFHSTRLNLQNFLGQFHSRVKECSTQCNHQLRSGGGVDATIPTTLQEQAFFHPYESNSRILKAKQLKAFEITQALQGNN